MQASRDTKLADEYPEHVATAWLGHSVKVAQQHYWQVTDDHFAKAIMPTKNAAQNPAQSVHAGHRNDSQKYDPRERKAPETRAKTKDNEAVQNKKVGQAGL